MEQQDKRDYHSREAANPFQHWERRGSQHEIERDSMPFVTYQDGLAGVMGSKEKDSAWFEVSRDTADIRVDIINPRSLHLGKSALLDTVIISPGEVFTLGRAHYQDFPARVSREHIQIENLDTTDNPILLRDMSTNGTFIFTDKKARADSYEMPPSFKPFNDSTESYPQGFRAAHYTSVDSESRRQDQNIRNAEAFQEKHHEAFPALSLADFAVAAVAISSLKSSYVELGQSRALERAFNRRFHPDLQPHKNEAINQQLYLLVKQELGL